MFKNIFLYIFKPYEYGNKRLCKTCTRKELISMVIHSLCKEKRCGYISAYEGAIKQNYTTCYEARLATGHCGIRGKYWTKRKEE